ncbi:VMAP-C domain-containing protein [Kitasatospora sp. NPDC001660]
MPGVDPTADGPGGWAPWSAKADAVLHEFLCEVADLHQPEFRHLVLGELRYRLGPAAPFVVPDSPQARDHLLNLVHACRQWHEPSHALIQLADVLSTLRPGTAAVGWLDAAVDAVAEPGLLAPQAQLVLLRTLRSLDPQPRPARVLHLVESACAPGETHPVRPQDGLPEAVSRLNQARLGDGPPLLLRFLVRLAAACPGPQAVPLTDLVERYARELGLAEDDLAAPTRQDHETTGPAQHHPLVLQITLDDVSPVGSDTEPVYVFEAALYDATEQPWRLISKRAGDEPLPRSALERHGSRHLTTWGDLAAAAANADGLRVEFLLPWSLLGHPAELWPMDEDDYPVGMHFPVVVRSLDRIRSAFWHTAWKNKWRALEATVESCGPGTVADLPGWIVHCDGTAPIDAELTGRTLHLGGTKGDVRRWLDSRPQTAILALSFPYAYHPKRREVGHQAVKDAVREGIPVMIWRRDDTGSPAELHVLLGELAAAQLPALAAHVQRRRRAASEDDRTDLGHHLTLLWDEPGHAAWLAPAPFRAPVSASPEGPRT